MKKLLEICKNGDAATRLSMVIMGQAIAPEDNMSRESL